MKNATVLPICNGGKNFAEEGDGVGSVIVACDQLFIVEEAFIPRWIAVLFSCFAILGAIAVAQPRLALAVGNDRSTAASNDEQPQLQVVESAAKPNKPPKPQSVPAATETKPLPATSCAGQSGSDLALRYRSIAPLSTAEECSLKPPDSFQECETCPEMVVMPAGSFIMGAPASETGSSAAERPQHRVTIAHQFAVGKFDVTFQQWDGCVADGGCNGDKLDDAGWGRGSQPAINVSWDDAKDYLDWLSRKTGKTYRLLSEAEWEYVARAGTTTPFWWGASISTDQANYNGNYTYGGGPKGEYRRRAVPVDTFAPNPWGLYQVHGNVAEWVVDCYQKGYVGAPSDGSARDGDCWARTARGGAWYFPPAALRAAARIKISGIFRSELIGFRVARSLLTP